MARKPFPLLVVGLLAVPAQSQEWSSAELQDSIEGFLEDSLQLQLAIGGELIQNQAEAYAAICAWIHGDHRDYLLRIERLLDSLSDDRWSVREDAERTLIETGGKARALLERRAQDEARPLEERIRCQRILDRIAAIGIEKEEREIRLLRGLVNTALYMDPEPRLLRALHSALKHTDPVVVEGSTRALGALGGDEDAEGVAQMVAWKSGQFRSVALAALPRIKGPRALELCEELLAGDQLTLGETMTLIRGLRQREDGEALLKMLAIREDPLVSTAASLELPPAREESQMVQLTLADRTTLTRPFLGFAGDSITVGQPAPGLTHAEVPFSQCDILDFPTETSPTGANVHRVFHSQGYPVILEQ